MRSPEWLAPPQTGANRESKRSKRESAVIAGPTPNELFANIHALTRVSSMQTQAAAWFDAGCVVAVFHAGPSAPKRRRGEAFPSAL